jgi:hypothetical protein
MRHIESYHPSAAPRPADLCVHVIEAAEREHDVVLAVREYLAMWGPEDLARLPAACRPGKINDAEDITDLAYRLSRAHLEFSGPTTDRILLERLMSFMSHAGTQVSRICARAQEPETDPQ